MHCARASLTRFGSIALFALFEKTLHLVVVADAHVVLLKVVAHLGSDFAVVDEDAALLARQEGKRDGHWRVGHIGAAQIEKPCYLVERRQQYAAGPGLLHGLKGA